MNIDLATIDKWLVKTGWDLVWTIGTALVVYWLALILIKLIVRGVTTTSARVQNTSKYELKKRQATVYRMLRTILKVIVIVVVIFTILNHDFNIDLAPLLASAGVVGVAIGFGAQNMIKDFLAGFFVILENQYRVGDWIEVTGTGVGDAEGSVEKMTLRSTSLRDLDGNLHFIPNGSIIHVVNRTIGFSKVNFKFKVATTEKIEDVKRIINETGTAMAVDKKWKDKIKEAIHFAEVGGFDKDGYEITITGTTEPAAQWDVTSEYRVRLLKNLKKAKIDIA